MKWNSISIELDLASVQWACGKYEKTNKLLPKFQSLQIYLFHKLPLVYSLLN